MVVLFAIAAVLCAGIGAKGSVKFHEFSGEDRLAIVTIISISAWPTTWTFLLGPALLGGVSTVLFPFIWYLPPMLLVIPIVARNLNQPRATLDLPAVLMASVTIFSLLALLEAHHPSELLRWAMCCVLAGLVVIKGNRITLGAVAYACRVAILIITVAVLIAIVLVPSVVTDCRIDKCGAAGRVLTSPFAGNGNVLGLTIALLLPFALSNTRVLQALGLTAAVIFTAELAGSRTAYIGIGFVVVMSFLLRVVQGRARTYVLVVGLVGALGVSLFPAVMISDDSSYSYRGALWNDAKEFISGHLMFGRGPTFWEIYGQSSVYDANYSPHNGWLDTVLSVGLVGTLVIVAAVALKVFVSAPPEREAVIIYFSGILGISTLESIFVPAFFGIVPCIAVLPFFVGPGRVPFRRFEPPSFTDRFNRARLGVGKER